MADQDGVTEARQRDLDRQREQRLASPRPSMTNDDRPVVKSGDEMDVETFLKHINARHVPIGKMTVFGRSNIPGDEDENLLRAYHDKIHEFDDGTHSRYSNETPINHTHRPAPKEST